MASFQNQEFYNKLEHSVEGLREWKLTVSTATLWQTFVMEELENARVSESPANFKHRIFRRAKALTLREDAQWPTIVLKACRELSTDTESHSGIQVEELNACGLLNSLRDFVLHLHFFQLVAREMEARLGFPIGIQGHKNSVIHDVDKLDPAMLAAYAEKFDDSDDTNFWRFCVNNHIENNPHHQGHPLWREGKCDTTEEDRNTCGHCTQLRNMALLEMICDKVARQLQKDLNGIMSNIMWDVNLKWFEGLPTAWMERCKDILTLLKS